jgi:hypothetical protein
VLSLDGVLQVVVVPITHSAPRDANDAIAVPKKVLGPLGLDGAPSWVVVSEANVFVWPGPDLRPIPGRRPRTPIYGEVPRSFLVDVARAYLARSKTRRSRRVPRTS